METRFFTGNFSFGQPFIILSSSQSEEAFFVEKFILFEGIDEKRFVIASRVSFPKVPDMTYQNFVQSEIQRCK